MEDALARIYAAVYAAAMAPNSYRDPEQSARSACADFLRMLEERK